MDTCTYARMRVHIQPQVVPVNDAPSFQILRTSLEFLESEPGSIVRQVEVAQNISRGPPLISGVTDEDDQQLSFLVTTISADTTLFHQGKIPEMAPNGTITLWLSPYMNGSAVINISLQDSGGTLRGGQNMSFFWKLVTVKVLPVNQRPTFFVSNTVLHVLETPQARNTQLAVVPSCRKDPLTASNLLSIARKTTLSIGADYLSDDEHSVTMTTGSAFIRRFIPWNKFLE